MAEWHERLGKGALRTGTGAAQGALVGAAFGPPGALIGGGIGAGLGLLSAFGADGAEEAAEAEDKKLKAQIEGPPTNPYQGLSNPYANVQNPYQMGGPAMTAMLSQQRGLVGRNFADAEQATTRALARHGMLGSGQEVAVKRDLAVEKAKAKSGVENNLIAQNHDKRVAFDNATLNARTGYDQWVLGQQTQFDEGRRRELLAFLMSNRDRYLADAASFDQAMGNLGQTAGRMGLAYGQLNQGGGLPPSLPTRKVGRGDVFEPTWA